MKLDNMFKKTKSSTTKANINNVTPEVPEGLLRKCPKCGGAIISKDVKALCYICPKCGGYFRVDAFQRLKMTIDEGTFCQWNEDVETGNPLEFNGYEEKIKDLKEKTNLNEAVITGKGQINGSDVAIAIMDGRFMMASMGYAVGEKIVRMVERATVEKLPVVIFACSGGARMQEGITSLMQMAKTSGAIKKHQDAGQLYISVLTDPTTGGVTASFAMLGDIIIAEPKALIGFAGPRVIEQTIGEKLPKGFQRSEFLLEHGFIDMIVEREQIKSTLSRLIKLHYGNENQQEITEDNNIKLLAAKNNEVIKNVKPAKRNCKRSKEEKEISSWERVEISRKKDRPVGYEYIELLFEDFIEMHGDRYFADDMAIIGGVASFRGIPVTVIAQAKGKNTKENIERNFGMPSPEGYRKALRLMKEAERFNRPIICFVDTPGAFCGLEAEERGQGEAIARCIYEMSGLKVPTLSIIIGEGGSGGALAMATSNEVWMLKNSIYSILSPEGFASILWKDSSKAKEAAKAMKLTANELYEQGIIEKVIDEPSHLTRENIKEVIELLDNSMVEFINKYKKMTDIQLIDNRYKRFRNM